MRSSVALVAAGATLMAATCVNANSPLLANFPNPDARFRDALSAQDLAIEAMLNTAPDSTKPGPKGAAMQKAFGNLFGAIRNDRGDNICGLVLANGSFVFSCSPSGSYSVDTVTDAQGAVTLFGFADGHFPYKQVLSGFGRWDMTLKYAGAVVDAKHTITFNITDGCNNGISIQYKFYDETNNLVWPSASSYYYTTAYNATYTHNLLCNEGAKVCYGARNNTGYWGVDLDNSKSCSDCCIQCYEGYVLSRRLTC